MAQARIKDRAVKTGEKEHYSFQYCWWLVLIMLVKHAAIPPEALRRVSVSLQNGMANCFYSKHVGRANSMMSVGSRRCACTSSCWICFCFQQKEGSGISGIV
jgi:hypothetical protein